MIMSQNKYGETQLAHIITDHGSYYISRDRGGFHVLRAGSPDGKELFSPVRDDGKKNTKTGRVVNVSLLYDIISNL